MEVLELLLHFILSMLVLAGGGVMLYSGHGDSQFIVGLMSMVAGFWFQGMSSKNLLTGVTKMLPNNNPSTSTTPTDTTTTTTTTVETPKTGNNI